MSHDFQRAQRLTLPLIPLGGVVAFPAIPLNFELNDAPAIAAAAMAEATDSFAFLISLSHPVDGDITEGDLFPIGTVAKIKQTVKAPEGELRRIPNVVLVGGSAEDFEIPEMLMEELASYRIVCGRGNIRATEGPRNAVATGLVLSYLGERTAGV